MGSIAAYEKIFGQDLNEDGSIGVALTYVQTDTFGTKLAFDSDKLLYIDVDGDETTSGDVITIKEEWGGSPRFDYVDSFSGPGFSSNIFLSLMPLNSRKTVLYLQSKNIH